MKKNILYIIFIFIVSFSFITWRNLRPLNYQNTLDRLGYIEIENRILLNEWYSDLYQTYEDYISLINNNQDVKVRIIAIENEFKQRGLKETFGNAPVGLVDQNKSGKSKKIYFHFSNELFELTKEIDPELLNYPQIQSFYSKLTKVDAFSREKFNIFIADIAKKHQGLRERMYGKRNDLILIVKIVRYNPSKLHASHPHHDFSGFSILMHNSEKTNESLLIGSYKKNITWADLMAPQRQYLKKGKSTSALFITGLGLDLLGFKIKPTPHAVKSLNETRYAVIVFAMIPGFEVTYDQIRIKMSEN